MTIGGYQHDSLRQTILRDIREGGLFSTLRRELEEIEEFYLDEQRHAQLSAMGAFSRFFHRAWWILRSMILKLTPARRILLLLSVVFLAGGEYGYDGDQIRIRTNTNAIGYGIVLFVLMLELKDKLLARSELEAGRAVQLALMPERSPAVPGWDLWLYTTPAREVGGDVVDIQRIADGDVGVALGDVAGKGLGAALFAARLQATIRAIAPDHPTPEPLVRQLNTILCRDNLPSRFASLIYFKIAPGENGVRLVNAGHPSPLVVRRDGIEELPRAAPALGLMAGASFAEQRVDLGEGDVLVVYSDGVTEARNERQEFFGEQRFRDTVGRIAGLPALAAGNRILSAIESFVGEARQHDDISLAVLLKKTS